MLRAYERGLDLVLKYQFTTLCVFFATLALSVYLFMIIPKGFFPQQDIGLITGISEASQDVSPAAMMRLQQSLGAIVMQDPAVDHVGMFVGGSGNAPNNGRMFIIFEAAPGPDGKCRSSHLTTAPAARSSPRREAVSASGARRTCRRPRIANPVPIYIARPGHRRAQRMGAEGSHQAQDLARAARRGDRPADRGHHADADDQPRSGRTLWPYPTGDRRHAL